MFPDGTLEATAGSGVGPDPAVRMVVVQISYEELFRQHFRGMVALADLLGAEDAENWRRRRSSGCTRNRECSATRRPRAPTCGPPW